MTVLCDDWPRAVRDVLDDADGLRLVFQPIVDLTRGEIAGYEALSRFDAEVGPAAVVVPPDEWFRQAALAGLGALLEARAVGQAVAALATLPPPLFLTVNISPALLPTAAVTRAFGTGRLDRLVVELTEHSSYDGSVELVEALRRLRARGALTAVDDTGSGYAGLGQLLAVRPQLVKVDRSLVARVDSDPGRAAALRSLGALAGQLDAWVLAEGLERPAELMTCIGMGVPLGQGYLLGRPAEGWTQLPRQVADSIRRAAALQERPDRLAAHVTSVPVAGGPEAAGAPCAVRLDDEGCPVALVLCRGERREEVVDLLRVHPDTSVVDAATRAVARPHERRLDPLVCVDARGRCVGVVPLDVLVLALVERRGTARHTGPD